MGPGIEDDHMELALSEEHKAALERHGRRRVGALAVNGCPRDLGYAPRPELDHWRGTPIPPVNNALRQTPRRAEIAGRVWWNGPPWTVLRNASHYLWHVMDYGGRDDVRFTQVDVPGEFWCLALEEARPGVLLPSVPTSCGRLCSAS